LLIFRFADERHRADRSLNENIFNVTPLKLMSGFAMETVPNRFRRQPTVPLMSGKSAVGNEWANARDINIGDLRHRN